MHFPSSPETFRRAVLTRLPLFAAVAAHYQAVPQAPRIILLDEWNLAQKQAALSASFPSGIASDR